ncbi:MAG: sensor histidine kinase [Pirellulales bacterium]
MKRPWHIWTAFGLCLAVVLAAMGWISLAAFRLDRAQAEARRDAALEENVRLALWRMDSALAPLVAQESARPYFAYSAFFPAEQAYSRMFNFRPNGAKLVASPLLSAGAPYVLVHFQFEPDGALTSPQAPMGGNTGLAVPKYTTEKAIGAARERLAQVGTLVDRDTLRQKLPKPAPAPAVLAPLAQYPNQAFANNNTQQSFDGAQQQVARGAAEYQARTQYLQQSANTMVQNRAIEENAIFATDVSGVVMTPLWIKGRLVLARRVAVNGREYVQGCLLDWPAVKTWLTGAVADLLPAAELVPVTAPAAEQSRMLASLPARLEPGPWQAEAASSLSPVQLSLCVAWACVLVAAVAVAALLLGVVSLSERRGAFVSAVTHELRTPLTTFQLYAEMLADDMVTEPQKRRTYLQTLRAEAARLTHLVENVLSYSRLERGRPGSRIEEISLDELVGRLQDRLAERAAQAGLELVVENGQPVANTAVRANVSAVEQILFNLVDNACKYAAAGPTRLVHLQAACNGRTATVRLWDHGPGISPVQKKRLFTAFSKSAHEAAASAPGVGLGLALSRRLARDMGGDLALDETVADGACFVLSLPAVPAQR